LRLAGVLGSSRKGRRSLRVTPGVELCPYHEVCELRGPLVKRNARRNSRDLRPEFLGGEGEWLPLRGLLQSTPGPGPLGSARKKGRCRKAIARSVLIAITSRGTAPALSYGERLRGLLESAACCGVGRDDGKVSKSEARLTCSPGSCLYPLGIALSFNPAGAHVCA
jgi:hypothetical protein